MNLRRRLRSLFRRRDLEAEMAEEMRLHLEQRTADLAADGLAPGEARLAAQRRFGNTAALQEQARDTFGWGSLERFAQDLRFAARQLVRSPGFSLLAIVTLGLGIGANTAMFSALNGVLLKPLPYAELPRLEQLHRATPQSPKGDFSPADFLALRQESAACGDFAAVAPGRVSLSDPGQPAQLSLGARASANLFSLLGVQPQLGRDFRPDEETPGRHRVVILGQRTWRNRYGAAPDIVGRTVRIDGEPHEVIGVLPPSFNDWRHLGNIDFFRPFALTPAFAADRKSTALQVIGRRAATLKPAAAAGFVARLGARLAREFPEVNSGSTWRTVPLQSVTAGVGGDTIMPMLVGLSGFVLLLACSNLANFLLARTMARAREFAVRAALGASRVQLLRPLVAESLLLSLAGGALAVLVAFWFRDWAAVRSTGDNGEQVDFAVNLGVMLWAFGASLVTALFFGLAPALFALRLDLNETLKSGGRGATGTRGHQRFRRVLIVGQFALAMILLSGALHFIRGLDDLHHRRAGWQSAQLVTGNVVLPTGTYGGPEEIAAFQRLALERLATLPGVASACLTEQTPVFHWSNLRRFLVGSHERPEPGREPAALVNAVSPAYFETFGTPLVSGRAFTAGDTATAPRVYLVSQVTARSWFGDTDPIGQRIAPADGGAQPVWGVIVGVVADFRPSDAARSSVNQFVYQPLAQEPPRQFDLAVRAAPGASPDTLVDPIRAAITGLDADLPVRRLRPTEQTIDRALYQLGVLRDMLILFGLLGLGLASLGIYGVIARTMAQRTPEFAIRLALGASARDLTRLVLGSGVRLALTGSALGLLGAIGVTRILVSAFPGMTTGQALSLGVATLVLVAVALLACWLPARRVRRIDALAALRAE